jgi:hypothetical protein
MRVKIKWGYSFIDGDEVIYEFETARELNAFLIGARECEAWDTYHIIEDDGYSESESLEGVERKQSC